MSENLHILGFWGTTMLIFCYCNLFCSRCEFRAGCSAQGGAGADGTIRRSVCRVSPPQRNQPHCEHRQRRGQHELQRWPAVTWTPGTCHPYHWAADVLIILNFSQICSDSSAGSVEESLPGKLQDPHFVPASGLVLKPASHRLQSLFFESDAALLWRKLHTAAAPGQAVFQPSNELAAGEEGASGDGDRSQRAAVQDGSESNTTRAFLCLIEKPAAVSASPADHFLLSFTERLQGGWCLVQKSASGWCSGRISTEGRAGGEPETPDVCSGVSARTEK